MNRGYRSRGPSGHFREPRRFQQYEAQDNGYHNNNMNYESAENYPECARNRYESYSAREEPREDEKYDDSDNYCDDWENINWTTYMYHGNNPGRYNSVARGRFKTFDHNRQQRPRFRGGPWRNSYPPKPFYGRERPPFPKRQLTEVSNKTDIPCSDKEDSSNPDSSSASISPEKSDIPPGESSATHSPADTVPHNPNDLSVICANVNPEVGLRIKQEALEGDSPVSNPPVEYDIENVLQHYGCETIQVDEDDLIDNRYVEGNDPDFDAETEVQEDIPTTSNEVCDKPVDTWETVTPNKNLRKWDTVSPKRNTVVSQGLMIDPNKSFLKPIVGFKVIKERDLDDLKSCVEKHISSVDKKMLSNVEMEMSNVKKLFRDDEQTSSSMDISSDDEELNIRKNRKIQRNPKPLDMEKSCRSPNEEHYTMCEQPKIQTTQPSSSNLLSIVVAKENKLRETLKEVKKQKESIPTQKDTKYNKEQTAKLPQMTIPVAIKLPQLVIKLPKLDIKKPERTVKSPEVTTAIQSNRELESILSKQEREAKNKTILSQSDAVCSELQNVIEKNKSLENVQPIDNVVEKGTDLEKSKPKLDESSKQLPEITNEPSQLKNISNSKPMKPLTQSNPKLEQDKCPKKKSDKEMTQLEQEIQKPHLLTTTPSQNSKLDQEVKLTKEPSQSSSKLERNKAAKQKPKPTQSKLEHNAATKPRVDFTLMDIKEVTDLPREFLDGLASVVMAQMKADRAILERLGQAMQWSKDAVSEDSLNLILNTLESELDSMVAVEQTQEVATGSAVCIERMQQEVAEWKAKMDDLQSETLSDAEKTEIKTQIVATLQELLKSPPEERPVATSVLPITSKSTCEAISVHQTKQDTAISQVVTTHQLVKNVANLLNKIEVAPTKKLHHAKTGHDNPAVKVDMGPEQKIASLHQIEDIAVKQNESNKSRRKSIDAKKCKSDLKKQNTLKKDAISKQSKNEDQCKAKHEKQEDIKNSKQSNEESSNALDVMPPKKTSKVKDEKSKTKEEQINEAKTREERLLEDYKIPKKIRHSKSIEKDASIVKEQVEEEITSKDDRPPRKIVSRSHSKTEEIEIAQQKDEGQKTENYKTPKKIISRRHSKIEDLKPKHKRDEDQYSKLKEASQEESKSLRDFKIPRKKADDLKEDKSKEDSRKQLEVEKNTKHSKESSKSTKEESHEEAKAVMKVANRRLSLREEEHSSKLDDFKLPKRNRRQMSREDDSNLHDEAVPVRRPSLREDDTDDFRMPKKRHDELHSKKEEQLDAIQKEAKILSLREDENVHLGVSKKLIETETIKEDPKTSKNDEEKCKPFKYTLTKIDEPEKPAAVHSRRLSLISQSSEEERRPDDEILQDPRIRRLSENANKSPVDEPQESRRRLSNIDKQDINAPKPDEERRHSLSTVEHTMGFNPSIKNMLGKPVEPIAYSEVENLFQKKGNKRLTTKGSEDKLIDVKSGSPKNEDKPKDFHKKVKLSFEAYKEKKRKEDELQMLRKTKWLNRSYSSPTSVATPTGTDTSCPIETELEILNAVSEKETQDKPVNEDIQKVEEQNKPSKCIKRSLQSKAFRNKLRKLFINPCSDDSEDGPETPTTSGTSSSSSSPEQIRPYRRIKSFLDKPGPSQAREKKEPCKRKSSGSNADEVELKKPKSGGEVETEFIDPQIEIIVLSSDEMMTSDDGKSDDGKTGISGDGDADFVRNIQIVGVESLANRSDKDTMFSEQIKCEPENSNNEENQKMDVQNPIDQQKENVPLLEVSKQDLAEKEDELLRMLTPKANQETVIIPTDSIEEVFPSPSRGQILSIQVTNNENITSNMVILDPTIPVKEESLIETIVIDDDEPYGDVKNVKNELPKEPPKQSLEQLPRDPPPESYSVREIVTMEWFVTKFCTVFTYIENTYQCQSQFFGTEVDAMAILTIETSLKKLHEIIHFYEVPEFDIDKFLELAEKACKLVYRPFKFMLLVALAGMERMKSLHADMFYFLAIKTGCELEHEDPTVFREALTDISRFVTDSKWSYFLQQLKKYCNVEMEMPVRSKVSQEMPDLSTAESIMQENHKKMAMLAAKENSKLPKLQLSHTVFPPQEVSTPSPTVIEVNPRLFAANQESVIQRTDQTVYQNSNSPKEILINPVEQNTQQLYQNTNAPLVMQQSQKPPTCQSPPPCHEIVQQKLNVSQQNQALPLYNNPNVPLPMQHSQNSAPYHQISLQKQNVPQQNQTLPVQQQNSQPDNQSGQSTNHNENAPLPLKHLQEMVAVQRSASRSPVRVAKDLFPPNRQSPSGNIGQSPNAIQQSISGIQYSSIVHNANPNIMQQNSIPNIQQQQQQNLMMVQRKSSCLTQQNLGSFNQQNASELTRQNSSGLSQQNPQNLLVRNPRTEMISSNSCIQEVPKGRELNIVQPPLFTQQDPKLTVHHHAVQASNRIQQNPNIIQQNGRVIQPQFRNSLPTGVQPQVFFQQDTQHIPGGMIHPNPSGYPDVQLRTNEVPMEANPVTFKGYYRTNAIPTMSQPRVLPQPQFRPYYYNSNQAKMQYRQPYPVNTMVTSQSFIPPDQKEVARYQALQKQKQDLQRYEPYRSEQVVNQIQIEANLMEHSRYKVPVNPTYQEHQAQHQLQPQAPQIPSGTLKQLNYSYKQNNKPLKELLQRTNEPVPLATSQKTQQPPPKTLTAQPKASVSQTRPFDLSIPPLKPINTPPEQKAKRPGTPPLKRRGRPKKTADVLSLPSTMQEFNNFNQTGKTKTQNNEVTAVAETESPRIASVDSGISSPVDNRNTREEIMHTCICGNAAENACMCLAVHYCSQQCQAYDWENHMPLCKYIQK